MKKIKEISPGYRSISFIKFFQFLYFLFCISDTCCRTTSVSLTRLYKTKFYCWWFHLFIHKSWNPPWPHAKRLPHHTTKRKIHCAIANCFKKKRSKKYIYGHSSTQDVSIKRLKDVFCMLCISWKTSFVRYECFRESFECVLLTGSSIFLL